MTALLKARDTSAQDGVRPFYQTHVIMRTDHNAGLSQAMGSDPNEASPLDTVSVEGRRPVSELEQLKSYVTDLEKQLEQARTQSEEQRQAAFAQGLSEGRKLAQDKEQEKLDLLAQGISEARQLLSDRVDQTQALAISIAQAALLRIMGDRRHYADLVADIIIYRAKELKSELILGVKVSVDDFATDAALEALALKMGRTDISVDPSLHSGACLFVLTLGQMDVSVPTQWTKLTELFVRLDEKEGIS